ncbi:hypothetical protein [Alkaliflexus imshenetskii]|uniref:hypothetical protein n=1 Tax=Alkaliflexus imshenetskii TaxID=286730 RepID=UPI0004BAE1D9|nr:hypothetical protein [Alkaliflexus imshenetskii]
MILHNYNGIGGTLDIKVDDRSYRFRQVMGDDKLYLQFSHPGYVEIHPGAYTWFEGRAYYLHQPDNFKKNHSREFHYTLELESEQGNLLKYKIRDAAEKLLKFPLTARPLQHIQLVVSNLNERESGWLVGDCIDAPEKLVNYNHTNLREALQMISETFETEWEIDGKTIHLRRVEYNKNNPLALSYGKGNGFKPGLGRRNTDEKSAVEVLHVQGGERNIDRSKYGNPELLLPAGQSIEYEGREYIVSGDGRSVQRSDKPLISGIEDSLDCTHIYPSRVGEVSEVVVVDANRHLYDFKDASIPHDLNYAHQLMDGETMTVVFQEGMLAGREFEIDSYVHSERLFRIVPQEADGLRLPNNIFKPEVGQKYAIFGIQLPDAYIRNDQDKTGASWDMLREAVKYLYENEDPRFTFTGQLDGIWAKTDWLNIGGKIVPGGYVSFTDYQFQAEPVLIRIVGIKDFINNPYSPEIELSNQTIGGNIFSELGRIKANEVVTAELHRKAIGFSKRRYRSAMETLTMLADSIEGFTEGINPLFVQTMSLLVGSESLQYRFVVSKESPIQVDHVITFNNSNKILTSEGGVIQHMTLGLSELKSGSYAPEEYRYWSVAEFNSPPLVNADKPYYLYIKASKTDETALFYLSEAAIKLEEVAGYYHLLVGYLNSEVSDERSFAQLYGFTEILPGRISTSKIHADTVEVTQLLAEQIYATDVAISGHLLVSGTIEASKIDVKGLLTTEDLYAKKFHLESGSVGAFQVDASILKAVSSDGNAIFIDPISREITIENRTVNEGVSAVRMKAGNLEPLSNLFNGGGNTYSSTLKSAGYSTWRTSDQLRASGGTNIPSVYIGRLSATNTLVGGSIPGTNNRFTLAIGKNYAVDLPYLFVIQHSGESANGRLHKLHGDLKVTISAVLKGVTAGGTTKELVSRNITMNINRSDNEIIDDEHPVTLKASFNSVDCISAYWVLNINLSGDLTYQRWTTDFLSKYWSTRTDWQIEFQSKAGVGASFFPSIAVTELTTSGFQTVWAQNRYFRIDGNDPIALIRSAGVWMHNGYEVATANDINTITADLTNYVLWSDLLGGYYTQSQVNTLLDGKANKNGSSTENFTVKDLVIHGTVNHWLGDTITVDDANLQLNRRQGGATVSSGIIIYNKDTQTEVSKLEYDTDNVWKAGGQRLYTNNYRPFADNAGQLGGVAAADYLRRNVNEAVTGAWTFQGNHEKMLHLVSQDLYGNDLVFTRETVGGANTILGRIRWNSFNTGNPFVGVVASTDGDNSSSAIRFYTTKNNVYSEVARISADGRLGLGTATPSERLHVAGNALVTGTIYNIANTERDILFWRRTDNTQKVAISSSGFQALNIKYNDVTTVAINAQTGTITTPGDVSANNILATGTGLFGSYVGSSSYVSQLTGWRITAAGDADFRHVFTNELRAKAFTADITQALVGSDVLTKSVAKLAQNWASTANGTTSTIYVEELEGFPGFQVFSVGDRLLLRLFDRSGGGLLIKNVWATVASYVSTTNNVQRYTITVNSGGMTGQTVYAGSMILDYGTSGSGVIERTVLDQQGSPYSRVMTWTGSPDSPANYTLHYQSGNLNGISNANGWGVYSENSFLTNKLLVGDLTKVGEYIEYTNGQLTLKGRITVTGGNAATKSDVDAVQVGGRNLALNQSMNETVLGSFSTTWQEGVNLLSSIPVTGDEYVLSFEAKSTVNGDVIHCYFYSPGTTTQGVSSTGHTSTASDGSTQVALTSSWKRYWVKYKQSITTTQKRFIVGRRNPGFGSGSVSVRGIKLEGGNKVTDWTPAPEDLPNQLDGILGNSITNNTTIISGGKIVTGLIDADWIRSSVVTATHINSLTLSTTKGVIGGFNIGSIRMWSGAESANDTTPGVELVSLANNQRLSMWRNIGNRILIYNYNNNDWGIKGFNGGNTVFSLGSQNLIAGVNFNHQSIWTNRWALNADGSGSFANGNISWTAAGDMEIDGSLIGNVIRSSNFTGDGNVGTEFDLTNGILNFANIIRIVTDSTSVADNHIQVYDQIRNAVGVKIGSFNLASLSALSGGLAWGLMTSSVNYPHSLHGFDVNGEGWVNSSRVITTTASNLVTGLNTGGTYALNAHFRLNLSTSTLRTEYISFVGGSNHYEGDLRLQVDILTSGNVLIKNINRRISLSFDSIIDVNVSTQFIPTTTAVRVRMRFISPSNIVRYKTFEPASGGNFLVKEYSCNVSLSGGSNGISCLPLSGVTEVSSRGFQSVWAADNYFRIDSNGIISAGGWNHDGELIAKSYVLSTPVVLSANPTVEQILANGFFVTSASRTLPTNATIPIGKRIVMLNESTSNIELSGMRRSNFSVMGRTAVELIYYNGGWNVLHPH